MANTAFEPVGKNGHYKGVALSYPHGIDLEAIALVNLDYTPLLKTDKNRNTPDGETKGFAKGIMIHVGGDYQNKAGDTFTTGSFGCFGISSGNSAIKIHF